MKYDYILMVILGLAIVGSWVAMRRATAKGDVGGRKSWIVAMSVCVMFLVIVIFGQFGNVYSDSFLGLMACVAILAGLLTRAFLGRDGRSKRQRKKR